MSCSDGWDYPDSAVDGVCPDCGEPTCGGEAQKGAKNTMDTKLSKRMIGALDALKTYGEYELWELTYWNSWHPINREASAPSIRTDTMKALINRGLVKESYNRNRVLWKWTAKAI